MPWHETAPGRYERPFDTLEHLYRGLAVSAAHLQKQHYLVSSAIKVKSPLSPTDLRHAWISLRHKHPHMAATPDDTGLNFVYTVPSPEALDAWVQESFIVYSDNDTRSVELLDIDLMSDQFTLHYLPHSRHLVFRAPHWRTDGRGMMLLQHEFCTLLAANPPPPILFDGSETSRLPPPLDEVANLSTKITPESNHSALAELSVLFSGAPLASFQETLPNTTPAKSHQVRIKLPQVLTKRIIATSKARNQTVTVIAHAALVTASRPHVTPVDGRLICFNPFDLRDRLPVPWNGTAGSATVYHTGKPCSIDLVQNPDFNAVADHLSAFYKQDLTPLFSFLVDYVQKISAILTAPLEATIQGPGAAHPELSSLGVIDNYLQKRYTSDGNREGNTGVVELEDWWLGVQNMNRELQMHVWMWDGDIYLACQYNAAFYERGFVEGFLEEWRGVFEGL
ncbi:hypothetical protein BDW59DRAFT_179898 [Aspergillus cavernicola]|uniref:Uncharacterized protein n=1 Tax=Aspergillus cavernicola TaxID=176166 RepID=A0ABR4IC59_9EURO